MGFKWFWNIRECSELLSDVLQCSHVIQGVIVGSELFWNVSERFWGIICPLICFDQFIKVPDVPEAFFAVQEVFWCILRCSEAFLWVLSCLKSFVKVLRHFFDVLGCFEAFRSALIRSEHFRKVPEGSEGFSDVIGVSWGFQTLSEAFSWIPSTVPDGSEAYCDVVWFLFEVFSWVLSDFERILNVQRCFSGVLRCS